jgi:hypothetical protein
MKMARLIRLLCLGLAFLMAAGCQIDTAQGNTKTEWKVLWAIAQYHNAVDEADGSYNRSTEMTAEHIELVKEKAAWYEAFVESHSNNKLDIKIKVDVLQYPVQSLAGNDHKYGIAAMDSRDLNRLKPEANFDTCIFSADYTDVPKDWAGLNWGFYMMIAFDNNYGTSQPTEDTKRYHTNLYVHEWIHQLEGVFHADKGLGMPVLHNDETDALYTVANTGLSGEYRLEKWYGDILQGTIVQYPGAANSYTGVHPDWWQYTPLWQKGGKAISPLEGSVGVSLSPTVVVRYENPITFDSIGIWKNNLGWDNIQNWQDRDTQFILSADGKTLTVFFPSTRWGIQPDTAYNLKSTGIKYVDSTLRVLRDANFEVNITTGEL